MPAMFDATRGHHMRLTRRIAGRITRDERGQSLVELALILPVTLVLFAAALDLGRAFYSNISVANAARAGALQAARTPQSFKADTECPVATGSTLAALSTARTARQSNLIVCAVQDEARAVVDIPATGIDYACEDASGTALSCPGSPAPGVRSRVTVQATMQLATPLLMALFPSGSVAITASAVADQLALPAAVIPVMASSWPSPSPSSSASPTPSPPASPTPTPEPTLAPGKCAVPNLDNLSKATAQRTWTDFGFRNQNFHTAGSNSGFVVAGSQTITPGTVWDCATTSITVTLQ